MGGGNCRAFCPEAHSKQIEIINPITPIHLNEISLQPAKEESNEIIEHYNAQDTTRDQPIQANEEMFQEEFLDDNTEKPQNVEPKYVENHIVVPWVIINTKVQDEVKLLLKKELPNSSFKEDSIWYLLPSGNYYSGQFKDGRPRDMGTYLLSNGQVYSGKTVDDKPQGMGVLIQKDSVFKGEFYRGQAHGKCRYERTGLTAEGDWTSGYMTYGKIITKQYIYKGELSYGKPNGDGQYKDLIEKIEYEGTFVQGVFDCQPIAGDKGYRVNKAKYQTPTYTYKGFFKAGKRHSDGQITYTSGTRTIVKEGHWNMDKFVSRQ